MQDAHTYLAESETLIRVQGLPKPVKSQKISKLHHIFSFLRIIHESTSLRAKESWQADPTTPLHERDEVQASGYLASSRLDWVEEEESDDSEEGSLFVSIYQMPATLLSLLSQTSSLCRQLGSAESLMPAFSRRCQIIEDRIFKWKAPESLRLPSYHENSALHSIKSVEATAQEVAAHLVNATYHALIVHFQRQIRNTNPRVLQHYVTIAADHLLVHEQLKQSRQISTAPFPWPGFIVACEAYDMAPREKMDMYLKMIRSYNVGNLIKAEKVIYEVWRRHDLGRTDNHWDDVLKDWDMQIVLT
jgi:arginine metabolism regulation protein II